MSDQTQEAQDRDLENLEKNLRRRVRELLRQRPDLRGGAALILKGLLDETDDGTPVVESPVETATAEKGRSRGRRRGS